MHTNHARHTASHPCPYMHAPEQYSSRMSARPALDLSVSTISACWTEPASLLATVNQALETCEGDSVLQGSRMHLCRKTRVLFTATPASLQ